VTVGIGLVGCGRLGLNYLRTFSELEGARIAGARDVSPARLREALSTSADVGLYPVGGFVRDGLPGRPTHHVGLAVEGSPTPVARKIAGRLGGASVQPDGLADLITDRLGRVE